ncbi:hypothetical protein Hanom_Chr05g00441241 [Helianthus anomalus]
MNPHNPYFKCLNVLFTLNKTSGLANFLLTLLCMICRSLGTSVHRNLQPEELEVSCCVLFEENN